VMRIFGLGAMYNAWSAFVDIRRDRRHEFPTYEDWILCDDPECRSFRQGWAAMGAILLDPESYPDPIDADWENAELCQPCPPSTPPRQETADGQGLA
jgi:hypothetical protein